jgi:hypothetical protein
MKTKFITTFLTIVFLLFIINQIEANANATLLTPEIKSILDNVKIECKLTDEQAATFNTDYVDFLNNTEKNNKKYTEDVQKKNTENQKVLFTTLSKLKTYLNADQQTSLIKLIQSGKLTPTSSLPASASVGATIKDTPAPSGTTTVIQPTTPAANTVIAQSNVAGLFEQLKDYMKVSADQYGKTLPILKDYDAKIIATKSANTNNAQKLTTEINAINKEVMPKLKTALKQDQINTLVAGVTMQENILSGKNITPQQKSMIDKIRTQYNLNDAQSMAVILVLVQGKVRGDAIQKIKTSNPDLAKKEMDKLLQDLDTQLKSSLNTDQYTRVKSDIEKLFVKK